MHISLRFAVRSLVFALILSLIVSMIFGDFSIQRLSHRASSIETWKGFGLFSVWLLLPIAHLIIWRDRERPALEMKVVFLLTVCVLLLLLATFLFII